MINQAYQISRRATATMVILAVVASTAVLFEARAGQPEPAKTLAPAATNAAPGEPTVELTPKQIASSIKIEAVATFMFPTIRQAVGSIDYNEDLSVQVFPSYPGKIIAATSVLGDDVQKGQPLFTIDSPDLIQAESSLISAAAALELTGKELARAKELVATNGVSLREFEQATSDLKIAEGTLKAARDAVRVFGKSEAEIDQVVATRVIDPALVVVSPVAGRITARNAQAGLLVQPGNAPAPYAVADLSLKWMLANVIETDAPLFQVGQPLQASVLAYPSRTFEGKIAALGTSVDSNTHRMMVRCEIKDPKNELRPGMLADFSIQVREPVEGVAIATTGVVRNGDGTMVAWVTTDQKHFTQRLVKLGLEKDGRYQVLEGLKAGEQAVSDGAVFISNLLSAPPAD